MKRLFVKKYYNHSFIEHYNEISQLFNPCFTQDTSVLDLLTRLQQSETGQQIYNQLKNSTSQLQVSNSIYIFILVANLEEYCRCFEIEYSWYFEERLFSITEYLY